MPSVPISAGRMNLWVRKPFVIKLKSLFSYIELTIETARDAIFDKWYRLDFGGRIFNTTLVTDHADSLPHTNGYEACQGIQLRMIIDEAMRDGINFDTFIDIGCGKGKACLYARREYSFKRVIGLDFSPPLIAIAEENAKKLGMTDVELITEDATTYALPPGNTLVFMYNPFDAGIMEAFLRFNLEHFRQNQSVIAYMNDHQRKTVSKLGFDMTFRDQTHKLSVFQHPDMPRIN